MSMRRLPWLLAMTTTFVACATDTQEPSASSAGQDLTEEPSYRVMYTTPTCEHEGKPSTWCTQSDIGPNAKTAGYQELFAWLWDRTFTQEQIESTM